MGRAPEVRDKMCKTSRSIPSNYAKAPLGTAGTERKSYSYLIFALKALHKVQNVCYITTFINFNRQMKAIED
jgi:hypothetical protein